LTVKELCLTLAYIAVDTETETLVVTEDINKAVDKKAWQSFAYISYISTVGITSLTQAKLEIFHTNVKTFDLCIITSQSPRYALLAKCLQKDSIKKHTFFYYFSSKKIPR